MKQDRNFGGIAPLAPGHAKVAHRTTVIPREQRVFRLLIHAWRKPFVNALGQWSCAAMVILRRSWPEVASSCLSSRLDQREARAVPICGTGKSSACAVAERIDYDEFMAFARFQNAAIQQRV